MTTSTDPVRETGAIEPPTSGLRGASSRRAHLRAYRHHLRTMRTQALVWIGLLAGVGAGMIVAYEDTFPTAAEREGFARAVEGVPALEALFGRAVELATLEGFVLWRWGGFAVLLVAMWGMLSGSGLLRGAEEAGHLEPLRAGTLTPRGLVGTALAALLTLHVALAITVGATHTVLGMDAATAWAFGAAFGLLAAVFAGGSALVSQLVATRRRVNGVVGTALGAAVVMRVVASGSGTPDWLWWATPFGWTTFLHDADGARVQVLASLAVTAAVLLAAALVTARRDLHGARFGGEEARAPGAQPVRSLTALSARLTLGPTLAWGAAIVSAGLVFGLLAEDFAEVTAGVPQLVTILEQAGFVALDTTEGVVALISGFLVLGLALFAAAQATAIREEEASWRIQALLVRPLGRTRWYLDRVGAAAAAVVLLAAGTAVATWLGTALAGTPLGAADTTRMALNLIPIAWLFLGLGAATFGLAPRITAAVAYGLVLVTFLIDLIASMLDLPEAVSEFSPFAHLAPVPADPLDGVGAAVMLVVGVVGVAAGAIAFRHRDLRAA